MALTDAELFDFDYSRMADWSDERARETLARLPDLYRNHLTIAKMLDQWIARGEKGSDRGEFQRGLAAGYREVAAHLRRGYLVPGCALYDEFVGS
ncbi:MAG: hypothetical protein M3P26_04165 [Gemmatimonadota bacterium]|nr:hypothetical protein [Gemmatimonadota bacterium]